MSTAQDQYQDDLQKLRESLDTRLSSTKQQIVDILGEIQSSMK